MLPKAKYIGKMFKPQVITILKQLLSHY